MDVQPQQGAEEAQSSASALAPGSATFGAAVPPGRDSIKAALEPGAGGWRAEHARTIQISFQTIYRHVRRDWKAGGQLYRQLRHHYRRRKRHYGLERRGRLPGKRMIDERPAEVETRQQLGHWEIDTVKGAGWEKPCILTMVERATGYVLIGKLANATTQATNRRAIALMRRARLPFRTLTSDNGTEFHGYREIEAATGAVVYFARPHHPWERGSNENTNGLIRQYSPKGKSMVGLTQKQCDAIAHQLNSRPRKRYGYQTPKQRLLAG